MAWVASRDGRGRTALGARFNRGGLECVSGLDGAAAGSGLAREPEILQRPGHLLVRRAARSDSSLFHAGRVGALGGVDCRGRTLAYALHASFSGSPTREYCLPGGRNTLGVVRGDYYL